MNSVSRINYRGDLMSRFHKRPNTFVNHVELRVQNLEQSLEFYSNFLGFDVLSMRQDKIELTVDGVNPIVTLIKPSVVHKKLPRKAGLYHIAFLLPSRLELAKFIKHLARENFAITGASDHLVSEALYFNDPDQNGIEVYVDKDEKEWYGENGKIHMDTLPLDMYDVIEEVDKAEDNPEWTKMPEGTLVGHIHLHVSNLSEAKTFYTDILGMDVIMDYAQSALFLSTGGYHHHIGLNVWNGVDVEHQPLTSAGLSSFALVIDDEQKLSEIMERVDEAGYQSFETKGRLYVADPSGNVIELQRAKSLAL